MKRSDTHLAAEPRRHAASFRDPAGYVARLGDDFIRVVNSQYAEDFAALHESGLYDALVREGLLIPHDELAPELVPGAFKVLRPRQVEFISYPYEWCFGQWRDAALATLRVQELALAHSMTLKDASAFNIQFVEGRPVFIDTLSFKRLLPEPWAAYGQFCRHFLAPLALMSYRDARLGQLLRIHLDGVPLDMAASLLPFRSRLRPSLLLHLHAHAASERWVGSPSRPARRKPMSRESLLGLVQTLRGAIQALRYIPDQKRWANYYTETVTGGEYVAAKQRLVAEWLQARPLRTLWDLGANTGLFSRTAADLGIQTVSFDGDIECVELNYRDVRENQRTSILPLFVDLANPSPAKGWANGERMGWLERPKPDAVLALALIHHLAIGNNVPLDDLAAFFARLAPNLIIEFVPKDDPNARKLLHVREDIFDNYHKDGFEAAFTRHFTVERSQPLPNSDRVLYLMIRKAA